MPTLSLADLQAKAKTIRKEIILSTTAAGSGHPTSSLSGELKPLRLSNTRRRAWRSTTPARRAGSHYAYRSLSGT